MILRVTVWVEQLMYFCVQKCKSLMTFNGIAKFVDEGFSGMPGSEEPAGTHEKLDQSTMRCPVDYATSVPTEKVQNSMNLETVLGEPLQHHGIKRDVLFTNRSGSSMNVNFEVTDTKRAIMSAHKGCGNASMIVFTPDGKGKIVNDKNCIEQEKQIMTSTPGFDIVYDRGAYVLDVHVNGGVYVNNERHQFEHNSAVVKNPGIKLRGQGDGVPKACAEQAVADS